MRFASVLPVALAMLAPSLLQGQPRVPDAIPRLNIPEIPVPGRSGGQPSQQPPPPQESPTRPAYEWFVRRPIPVALPVDGPEPVRARIVGAVQPPAGTGCRFDGPVPEAFAAPERGVAQLNFLGWLRPVRGFVANNGDCRLLLDVARRAPDGSWGRTMRVEAPAVPVTAHDRVRIQRTARMRDWLKPDTRFCAEDNAGDQLGVRVVAGPLPVDCRVELLSTSNRNRNTEADFNEMPEAVILASVTWRLDGDRQVCALCDNIEDNPCRGETLPSGPWPRTLLGPVVRDRTEVQGAEFNRVYSVFTGPPTTPRNGTVLHPPSGVIIGTNRRGDWRSYGFTMYARIACAPWAPPPADVGRAVGNVIGAVRNREAPPPPPPAPSLRLVLAEWEVLRPKSIRLPYE